MTPDKYRKLPVVIEAMQFAGTAAETHAVFSATYEPTDEEA